MTAYRSHVAGQLRQFKGMADYKFVMCAARGAVPQILDRVG